MENFGPLLLTPGVDTSLPAPLTHNVEKLLLTNQSPYMVQVKGGANGGAQAFVPPHSVQIIPLVRNEFTGMVATPFAVAAGQPASNTLWGSWVSPSDQVPGVYPHAIPQPAPQNLPTNISTFTISNAAYQSAVNALNPIARWQFNDPVGSTTIADTGASGAYTGTINGGVTLDYPLSIGMVDVGATFDGTSGYVTIPAGVIDAAFANQESYALVVTLKTISGTPRSILSSSQTGPGALALNNWRLQAHSNISPAGAMTWDSATDDGTFQRSIGPVVPDGAQHQLALAVTDGLGVWYLDGQPSNQFVSEPTAGTPPTAAAWIGQYGGQANFFAAALADLMFLPSLTAEQAAGLADAANVILTPAVPEGAQMVGYSYHGAPPNTQMVWLSGNQPVWHSTADGTGSENAQLTTPIPLNTGPLQLQPIVPPGSTPPGTVTGTILWQAPTP